MLGMLKKLPGFVLETALVAITALPAAAQSNINLRLMPMGDSITAGYRSSTGDGYRGPLYSTLAGQVGAETFIGSQSDGTMSDPYNEGYFGYQIAQITALATGQLNIYRPNIITLHIGSNDLNEGYEVSTAPQRLATLIDEIIAAQPDATLLVAQLIINSNATTEARIVTYNSQIPAIVQARANQGKHIAMVSMSALTTADLADGLHPNDGGYAKMATAWDGGIKLAIANGWIYAPVTGSALRPTGAIASGLPGKCLDDLGGSTSSGTAADLSDCNNGASQQWNANNGNVTINGKCLDIDAAGTANGTLVDLYNCNGGANQVWVPQQGGALVNPASGKCLDDPGSNNTNGTKLQIYTCNSGANQRWLLPTLGPVASGIADKCLDLYGGNTANGAKVDLYDCNLSGAQIWQVSNNLLQIGGKCLDITGGATINGTLVQLYGCTGNANQVWVPQQNGSLMNPSSGKCLDDPASTTVNGTPLQIWMCNGGTNQIWTPPVY